MRQANFFGRHSASYGEMMKTGSGLPKPPDKEEKKKALHHPLQVGKARKDEPKIQQPMGAELGIVPELNFRLLLTGPSNSGKTNFARWIIDRYYSGAFQRKVLMSPTAGIDPAWKDLKGLKKTDRIEKLKIKPLKRLLKEQEAKVKAMGKVKANKVLLILDDTIGNTTFIGSPEFLQVFIRGRHFNISSIVMTQSYVKLPRSVRLQATQVAMFPSFRSEIERLYEDHGPYQLTKKQWFSMVMESCQKSDEEEWPFFYLDTLKPVQERYRKCLYQIMPVNPSATADDEPRAKKGRRKTKKDEELNDQQRGEDEKEGKMFSNR